MPEIQQGDASPSLSTSEAHLIEENYEVFCDLYTFISILAQKWIFISNEINASISNWVFKKIRVFVKYKEAIASVTELEEIAQKSGVRRAFLLYLSEFIFDCAYVCNFLNSKKN